MEKEVVQTSWESWTPANAPPSSSSGALDTHKHASLKPHTFSGPFAPSSLGAPRPAATADDVTALIP